MSASFIGSGKHRVFQVSSQRSASYFNVASTIAVVGVLALLVRKACVKPSPGNLVTAAEHYRRLNRQVALLCYVRLHTGESA
ncbi:hypothetical protein SAMN02745126_06388 [Enhydrobacter aerosaccus]|uniref:Uncharacterized protein n=2 Tax=Enhydrobacter aerosaccus TaxID=225324 RepID=A0A1T4TK07_9HYPH|nr:hypothetical protein SAMN02745126_06388 [Enhydrobacter aerosaccus]